MKQKFLHHLGVGAGFLGLIGWFWAGRELGIMDWAAQQVPPQFGGAGLMVGIIIVMTPGFYIWKLINRWLERTLAVQGMYYEDEYYASMDKAAAAKKKAAQQDQRRDQHHHEGRDNNGNDNDKNDGGGDSGGGDGGGDGGGGD